MICLSTQPDFAEKALLCQTQMAPSPVIVQWDMAVQLATVSIAGTLKYVKSSLERAGGIVLPWFSSYGEGGYT